jgi:hypothetical protein
MRGARVVAAWASVTTLALLMSACGSLDANGVRDGCDLEVRASHLGKDQVLQPPYRATLESVVAPRVAISFVGHGWGQTQVDIAGPIKAASATITADQINEQPDPAWAPMYWTATAPGTWHFRLASPPCLRTIDVEVLPGGAT